MHLRYDLNGADIHLWYRHQVETSPQWIAAFRSFQRTRLAMTLACPLVAAFTIYVLYQHGRATHEMSPIPLIITCSCLVYCLWYAHSAWQMRWPKYVERGVTQLEQAIADSTLIGSYEIELAPGQFRFIAPRHTVVQQWTEITRIDDTPAHIFIVRADTHCYVIPKRAFPSASAIAEFLAAARAHHKATGQDPDSIASKLLATQDFPCPACRYNLRGAVSATCPECGAFFLHALPY